VKEDGFVVGGAITSINEDVFFEVRDLKIVFFLIELISITMTLNEVLILKIELLFGLGVSEE
jgi:AAA+ ATPase superfamily predicted ATPase